MKFQFKNHLLVSTALVGIVMMPSVVWAACSESNLNSGSGVSCSVDSDMTLTGSSISSGNTITLNAKVIQSSDKGIQIQSSLNGTPTLIFNAGSAIIDNATSTLSNPPGISISHGNFSGAVNIQKGAGGTLKSGGDITISGGNFNFGNNSLIQMVGQSQAGSILLKGGNFTVNGNTIIESTTGTHTVNISGGTYQIESGQTLKVISNSILINGGTFTGSGTLFLYGDANTVITSEINNETGNLLIGGLADVQVNANASLNSLKYSGTGTTLKIAKDNVVTIKQSFEMNHGSFIDSEGGIHLFGNANGIFNGAVSNLGFLQVDTGTVNFFAGSTSLGTLNAGQGTVNFSALFDKIGSLNLEQGTVNIYESINVDALSFGESGELVFHRIALDGTTPLEIKTVKVGSDIEITDQNKIIGEGVFALGGAVNAVFSGTAFSSASLTLEVGSGTATFNTAENTFKSLTLGKGTALFNGNASLDSLTMGVTGSDAGVLSVSIGKILNVKNIETVIGAKIQGEGTLKITGTGLFNGQFINFGQVIVDTGTTTFGGQGDTLKILTVNTGNAVLGGNLTLDALNFTGSGSVTINAGGLLALKSSTVSGSGNTITGAGTLQLLNNANITFGAGSATLGGLIIGSGTATVTSDATLGTIGFSSTAGGTLIVADSTILNVNTDITTSGANLITGGGTLKLVGNANGHFGATIADLGKLEIGNGTATFNVNSSLGNVVFTSGGTGKIEIANGIIISLSRALSLDTNNSIMGAGTLNLAGSANATLNTGSDSLGYLLVGSGTAAFNADSKVNNINFASTGAGTVDIASGTELSVGSILNTAGTNVVSGQGTLLIADNAVANFGAVLNNLDTLKIAAGTANFYADATLKNFSFTSAAGGIMNIAAGKTVNLTTNITTAGTNNITGAGTLHLADSKTATFASSITGLGNLKIGNGAEALFNSDASIGNILFDTDTGGSISINSGKTVNVTNSIVLGTGNEINGVGTLNLYGNASAVFATAQSFSGILKIGTGVASFNKNMSVENINFASGAGGTVRIADGQTLTMTNSITTTGNNNITGGGTLALNGASNGNFGAVISSLGGLNIGTGTAAFSADASVGKINFGSSSGGTILIAAGKTVSVGSDVTTAGTNSITGNGVFQLAGASNGVFNSALTGLGGLKIGTGKASINQDSAIGNVFFTSVAGEMNIAAGKKLTLSSDIHTAGTNAVTGTGTLEMAGNAGAVFNSALNFDGTLAMNAGTARFNVNSTVNTINVGTGVLDIDATRLTAGTVDLAAGSTLALRLKNNATDTSGNVIAGNFGVLDVGTLNVNGASNLKVTIDYGMVTKEAGSEFKIVEGTINNASNFTLQNNRYKFEDTSCSAGLCYKITQTSNAGEAAGEAGGSQNNVDTAHGFLDGKFFEPGSELAKVAEHLDYLSQHYKEAYTNALTALAPDVTGGMSRLPMNVQGRILNTVSTRMYGLQGAMGRVPAAQQNYNRRFGAYGRSGGSPYEYRWMPADDYYKKAGYGDEPAQSDVPNSRYQRQNPANQGYAPMTPEQRMKRRIAQRREKNFGLWAQGFYNTAEHFSSSDPNGFSGDTTGLALGFDAQVWDGLIVGIGYANTKSDIDSLQRSTDMTGNSAFLYSMYKPDKWFVSAVLNYSQSSSDETKDLSGMEITDSYDSTLFGGQVMVGYDYGWMRPAVGLRYASVTQDGHTDSIGQEISEIKNNVMTGLVETRFSKDIFSSENRYWRPELMLGVSYDFSSDKNTATVNLPNSSSYTVTGENLDKLAGEVGLSISYLIGDNADISLGYSGEFRKNYTSHTGLLSFRYNF